MEESRLQKNMIKKEEEIDIKQSRKDEQTTFQKFVSGLRKIFIGDSKLPVSINTAIVASTYIQFLEIINVILLFTYFQQTNSSVYSIIIATLTLIFFMIDIVPKVHSEISQISQKYYVLFNFVFISTFINIIVFICVFKVIADNLTIFQNICDEFNAYYKNNQGQGILRAPVQVVMNIKDQALNMCSETVDIFWIQIGIQSLFIVIKIAHFFMYVYAYKVSKQKHEFLQRKRRRKQRYNFMVRQKVIWDEKRKI